MPKRDEVRRLTIRMAADSDRDTIYRLRHEVYGRELRQHSLNSSERLSDPLDRFNVYLLACAGDTIAGFISVTPPSHDAYSIDKYLKRDDLPFPVNNSLYEMRLLTVLPEYRKTAAAFLLMYAATVWIWANGGERIVAIGRNEVLGMYLRIGMVVLEREIQSGEVTFQLMCAEIATLHRGWQGYAPLLRRLEAGVDWQLDLPYLPPVECFHGGASFAATGVTFDSLGRRSQVINADVLDAWFPPRPACSQL